MQVENNWTRTRYTFICEDKKDEEFLDKMNKYIDGLEEENKKLKEKQKVLDKENCKLIDENVKLKKRVYQNVHGGPRIDYQEFCKKNGI